MTLTLTLTLTFRRPIYLLHSANPLLSSEVWCKNRGEPQGCVVSVTNRVMGWIVRTVLLHVRSKYVSSFTAVCFLRCCLDLSWYNDGLFCPLAHALQALVYRITFFVCGSDEFKKKSLGTAILSILLIIDTCFADNNKIVLYLNVNTIPCSSQRDTGNRVSIFCG